MCIRATRFGLFGVLLILICACHSSPPIGADEPLPSPEQRQSDSSEKADPAQTEDTDEVEEIDEEVQQKAPTEPPAREVSCETGSDCTTMTRTPDCCPSCYHVIYNVESAQKTQAYCSTHFSPADRAECPVLACKMERPVQTFCSEGICLKSSLPDMLDSR